MTYGKALRIYARKHRMSPKAAQVTLLKRALKRPIHELIKHDGN